MSAMIYLIRAPRYNGASFEQINMACQFVATYVNEDKVHTEYIADLPPKEVLKFVYDYYKKRKVLLEERARFSKASQLLSWLMKNVACSKTIPTYQYYEVSKEKLEAFLEVLSLTRRYGIEYVGVGEQGDQYKECIYKVNESAAKTFLPLLEAPNGNLMFPYKYGSLYAQQIIDAIRSLNEILATTDFETQTIYFRYI